MFLCPIHPRDQSPAEESKEDRAAHNKSPQASPVQSSPAVEEERERERFGTRAESSQNTLYPSVDPLLILLIRILFSSFPLILNEEQNKQLGKQSQQITNHQSPIPNHPRQRRQRKEGKEEEKGENNKNAKLQRREDNHEKHNTENSLTPSLPHSSFLFSFLWLFEVLLRFLLALLLFFCCGSNQPKFYSLSFFFYSFLFQQVRKARG